MNRPSGDSAKNPAGCCATCTACPPPEGTFQMVGWPACSLLYKKYPCPVCSPSRQVVAAYIDIQLLRHAAARIDDVDIGFATDP